MDFLITIISIVGGGIAGFLSSYFFWNRDKQLIKPRLSLVITGGDSDFTYLGFENEGGSFAENVEYIVYEGEKDSKSIKFDSAIKPNAKFGKIPSSIGDHFGVSVFYTDVFGNEYKDDWQIYHPSTTDDGSFPEPIISKGI